MNLRAWPTLLLTAVLLGACSSAPPQPAAIAQYERDMNRAQERFHEGRLTTAAASYRQAVANGERFDDAARLAPALLGWAAAALELEDFAEAAARYREAAREADRAGLTAVRVHATLGAAETARRQGDCVTASTAGEALLGQAAETEIAARIQLLLANCLVTGGQAQAALAKLAALDDGLPPLLQSARLASEAAARLALGDPVAARAAAEAALLLDRRERHPPAIAADHRLLAGIASDAGDPLGALLHARLALRIYRQTGQTRPAARLLDKFPGLEK